MWMDYLAFPHTTDAKHVRPMEAFVNFEKMKAYWMEGHEDDRFSLTAIGDIVKAVLLAIDYEGSWPAHGGVVGETVSFRDLLALGESIRGRAIAVDYLKPEDVEAGVLKVPIDLDPATLPPSIPAEQAEAMMKAAIAGTMRAVARGGMVVDSGDWNHLLPAFKPVKVEEMLRRYL